MLALKISAWHAVIAFFSTHFRASCTKLYEMSRAASDVDFVRYRKSNASITSMRNDAKHNGVIKALYAAVSVKRWHGVARIE